LPCKIIKTKKNVLFFFFEKIKIKISFRIFVHSEKKIILIIKILRSVFTDFFVFFINMNNNGHNIPVCVFILCHQFSTLLF